MTYTQTIEHLKSVAESVKGVNTVTRGEVSQLDLDKQNIYPLVHIDIESGSFAGAKVMNYEIYIACLAARDISSEVVADKFWRQDNEVDNHNETLIILQTIWSRIYRDWSELYIGSTDNPAFQKITYAKGNILDGWSLTFTIEIPFAIDLC